MNKKLTEALIIYCDLKFGRIDISANECLSRLDKDARDSGLTRMEYLDYVIANGKLPK